MKRIAREWTTANMATKAAMFRGPIKCIFIAVTVSLSFDSKLFTGRLPRQEFSSFAHFQLQKILRFSQVMNLKTIIVFCSALLFGASSLTCIDDGRGCLLSFEGARSRCL